MARIAVYSSKGGVGKTTLAVNLAWAAASLSSRRTLLWDLDAQAGASFILKPDRAAGDEARAVIERDLAPRKLIVPTAIPNLDLLPADASLRTLDLLFAEIDRKKRLLRISEALDKSYDRIIIDCPPGLGVTAEQIIRGASLIVLPVIPSTLSARAAEELISHFGGRKGAPAVVTVFNMVDRRRLAHRAALDAAPTQHALPMASLVEQMADRHAPVGVYAPRAPMSQAIAALWQDIERRVVTA
ncbi:ParA family protein [Sphingomonas crusticola]|uniref:ParA family protein n=1 Tax=Sphingomonas crusticola TaxID=1697973 RepID=UPI000E27A34E|nr:AAA family ATPase [Sphingomonas crusticola]